MKTIAVMTLIFMPLGTTAGIFGTQFMKLDEYAPFHLRVSQDFWLLWIIAVPLTGIVVWIWRKYYLNVKKQLINEVPERERERARSWGGILTGKRRRHDFVHTDYEKVYDAGVAASTSNR